MSLIERALEKSRAISRETAPSPVDSSAVRPVATPVPVVVTESNGGQYAEPDLQLTEELLQVIGVRAPEESAHQQASEYRHIKRQLIAEIRENPSGNSRLILVTSALAGEGKSYTAVNLALSLSLDPDFQTLLVDGDVIKPNVTRQFGLESRRGLMDVATNAGVDAESLVVSTSIPRFSLLPAGVPSRNATEHFGSARMGEVFRNLLRPSNRIVVVDSLPMLLTTEARSLAAHAGQVVFVVRAESTPKNAVLESIDLLGQECNIKLVLNAIDRDKLSQYYGYQYNYNYGAGG